MQAPRFAACDDLLAALSNCPDGQVACVSTLLGRPRQESQLAIELASDGEAVTTESLLLGLLRAGCSSTASWLRLSDSAEADVVRAIERCAPDAMRPAPTT